MKLDKLKEHINEIYYICINRYTNAYFSYDLCDTLDIKKALKFHKANFAEHYLKHVHVENIYRVKKYFK